MRSNSIVIIFGVVSVVVAALILTFSGSDEPDGPMTPAEHGRRLFRMQGCHACHGIGGGISRGPDLAGLIPRLEKRLSSAEYRQQADQIKHRYPKVYKKFEASFTDIFSYEGDDRIRVWLAAHLKNPRFDHLGGQMPAYAHLTSEQVERLAAYLFTLR